MPRKKTALAEPLPETTESPPVAIPVEMETLATSPGESKGLPEASHETNGHGPAPAQNGNGNGEKRQPAFKVGPIATDKDNAVSVAVWANEHTTRDGRTFTVYNATVEARWRDVSGEWKSGKQFRGSQIYALVYCLQRASDWILSMRDPQNSPF